MLIKISHLDLGSLIASKFLVCFFLISRTSGFAELTSSIRGGESCLLGAEILGYAT